MVGGEFRFPPDDAQLLPNLLLENAERNPDVTFLTEVGHAPTTFRRLATRSAAFASALGRAGVGAGDVVATFLDAGEDAFEVWMGICYLGGIEAALNTRYRYQLLADVLNDCKAKHVVTTSEWLPALFEVVGSLNHVECVHLLDPAGVASLTPSFGLRIQHLEGMDAATSLPARTGTKLEDISCLLYTSGTTGPSKGVPITWAHMYESARTIVPLEAMDADDVFYAPFAPCHITGKAYLYSMMLLSGRYVVRASFKTTEFWGDIRRYGCTTTLLQGATAHFLLNLPPSESDTESPLKQLVIAPVIAEVADFERRFDVRVGTVYNMTELSCPLVSGGWFHSGKGSCGTPRAGVTARIVDAADREVGVGVTGELVIRHDDPWTMAIGYLNRPEATVQAMRNNWFHTGDGFFKDAAGEFFFVDRIKDSIRRRGENISSSEIEREVRMYPDVAECAAVASASELSEDDVRLFVVPRVGSEFRPERLYAFLKARLATYMLPRYIDIIADIPKTETEKIQKNLLRSRPLDASTWSPNEQATRRLRDVRNQ